MAESAFERSPDRQIIDKSNWEFIKKANKKLHESAFKIKLKRKIHGNGENNASRAQHSQDSLSVPSCQSSLVDCWVYAFEYIKVMPSCKNPEIWKKFELFSKKNAFFMHILWNFWNCCIFKTPPGLHKMASVEHTSIRLWSEISYSETASQQIKRLLTYLREFSRIIQRNVNASNSNFKRKQRTVSTRKKNFYDSSSFFIHMCLKITSNVNKIIAERLFIARRFHLTLSNSFSAASLFRSRLHVTRRFFHSKMPLCTGISRLHQQNVLIPFAR